MGSAGSLGARLQTQSFQWSHALFFLFPYLLCVSWVTFVGPTAVIPDIVLLWLVQSPFLM